MFINNIPEGENPSKYMSYNFYQKNVIISLSFVTSPKTFREILAFIIRKQLKLN